MLEVLYADNHLLVVYKPPGLLTQPNDSQEENLEDWAKTWVKEKYAKKGAVFLHAVHRLDKPVSGIVLFARTSKALSRLNEQQRGGEMEKTYFAEVEGCPPEDEGTLEHYLRHDDFRAVVSKKEDPEAKRAVLSFLVLERKEKTTILEIRLITGRYHQIRAQLAAARFPVVGDSKYGSSYSCQNIRLHHGRLEFFHPIAKDKVLINKLLAF